MSTETISGVVTQVNDGLQSPGPRPVPELLDDPAFTEHPDCAESRRMAAGVCRFCQKSIGYDTPFFVDPDNEKALVHALCLEEGR